MILRTALRTLSIHLETQVTPKGTTSSQTDAIGAIGPTSPHNTIQRLQLLDRLPVAFDENVSSGTLLN